MRQIRANELSSQRLDGGLSFGAWRTAQYHYGVSSLGGICKVVIIDTGLGVDHVATNLKLLVRKMLMLYDLYIIERSLVRYE